MKPTAKVTIEQAIPSFGHMALVALEKAGLLKHLVSTNVDGLHLRAGTALENLSELHGNCFKGLLFFSPKRKRKKAKTLTTAKTKIHRNLPKMPHCLSKKL
jgi:NAD-dependent SIR2 family protein deacetylase